MLVRKMLRVMFMKMQVVVGMIESRMMGLMLVRLLIFLVVLMIAIPMGKKVIPLEMLKNPPPPRSNS